MSALERRQPPKPEPEPMRWEISLFSPAPPAPAVSPASLAPALQPVAAQPSPKPVPPKPKPKPKPKAVERPAPKLGTRYLAVETPEEPALTVVASVGPLARSRSPTSTGCAIIWRKRFASISSIPARRAATAGKAECWSGR